MDVRHKVVRDYEVSAANLHDSRAFAEVLDPDNLDAEVWADSAYRSTATEAKLTEAGYCSHNGVRFVCPGEA